MKKNSVGLLELETAVLECFLEKTPLSPLGLIESLDIKFGCRAFAHYGHLMFWSHPTLHTPV
jgi:hypothetical protein